MYYIVMGSNSNQIKVYPDKSKSSMIWSPPFLIKNKARHFHSISIVLLSTKISSLISILINQSKKSGRFLQNNFHHPSTLVMPPLSILRLSISYMLSSKKHIQRKENFISTVIILSTVKSIQSTTNKEDIKRTTILFCLLMQLKNTLIQKCGIKTPS